MTERDWSEEFRQIIKFSREYAEDFNVVERASRDIRICEAADYELFRKTGKIVFDDDTYEDILVHVAEDYYLDPEDVRMAMNLSIGDLAEDRYGEA